MKKHIVFRCAVILILIAIFTAVLSCSNFGIPETVEIKTNARYALNMGFDILDMSEYLSYKTIQEKVGDGFNVYDYNPGGTAPTKHFLIEYPAINQSIDISKHFENLDFGTEIDNSMGFDESFQVEPIDIPLKVEDLSAMNTEFRLDDPAHPITVTIGTVGSANITKAVIKTGSVTLAIPKPAGWNDSVKAEIKDSKIELTGGIVKSYTGLTEASTNPNYLLYQKLDLAGREFTPLPVGLVGTITLTETQPGKFFDFKLDLIVTEYESVTVDIGKVETSHSFHKELPSELKNFVKSINCNEVGVKFKYKNNLPNPKGTTPGTDDGIYLKMTSNFLGITGDGKKVKLENDGITHNPHISTGTRTTLNLETGSNNVDINVELMLPDSKKQGEDVLITVHDILVGQTYSLSLTDFQLILDWESIKVKTNSLSANGEKPLNIDFNSMFKGIKDSVSALKNFVDELQVGDIPVYMYVAKPAEREFENLDISVSELKILGNNISGINLLDGGNPIKMTTKPLPSLERDKTVRTDFSKLDYLASLNKEAFKTIINDRKDGLKLKYSISPSGGADDLEISKTTVDDIKKNGGTLEIKAAVYIDIPLRLTVKNETDIDMMEMAGMDNNSDLMGRSEPLSIGETEKYMDSIKSVEMIMNMQNSIFFDGDSVKINFVIDDSGIGSSILGKKLYPLSNLIIGFTTEETKQILKSDPPYMPAIKINFPSGSGFQIPQSGGKLGFSGKVSVVTDGSIIIGDSK